MEWSANGQTYLRNALYAEVFYDATVNHVSDFRLLSQTYCRGSMRRQALLIFAQAVRQ